MTTLSPWSSQGSHSPNHSARSALMPTVYLDTSALVERYVSEVGTAGYATHSRARSDSSSIRPS